MNGEDGDLLLGSLLITAVIGVMYIVVVGATSTKPLMIQRVMDIIKWINLLSFNTLDGQVRLGWHRYDYWFSSGESPNMTSAIGEGLMIPSSHRSGYKKQGSRGLEWRGVEETGNTHDVRDPE